MTETPSGGTYTVRASCNNCGYTGDVTIPKGNSVEVTPCPTCGVKKLQRRKPPPVIG